jgi:hypothetical protein
LEVLVFFVFILLGELSGSLRGVYGLIPKRKEKFRIFISIKANKHEDFNISSELFIFLICPHNKKGLFYFILNCHPLDFF